MKRSLTALDIEEADIILYPGQQQSGMVANGYVKQMLPPSQLPSLGQQHLSPSQTTGQGNGADLLVSGFLDSLPSPAQITTASSPPHSRLPPSQLPSLGQKNSSPSQTTGQVNGADLLLSGFLDSLPSPAQITAASAPPHSRLPAQHTHVSNSIGLLDLDEPDVRVHPASASVFQLQPPVQGSPPISMQYPGSSSRSLQSASLASPQSAHSSTQSTAFPSNRQQPCPSPCRKQAKKDVGGFLAVGTSVEIKGMKSRTDLNGRKAEIINYVVAAGRYELLIQGSGERIRAQPENITLVTGSSEKQQGRSPAPTAQQQPNGAGRGPSSESSDGKYPWGRADQDGLSELQEIALRQEDEKGPPGPAGHQFALAWTAGIAPPNEEAQKFCLWKYAAWTQALNALDLPVDDWHCGKGPSSNLAIPSFLRDQNLATIKASPDNGVMRKWQLLVLVRTVRAKAGEVELIVCDPTTQMEAFLDHRVLCAWPDAIREGVALALQNAVVLHPNPTSWQLLITVASLVRPFVPAETSQEGMSMRQI